jgi:hypothetical protein
MRTPGKMHALGLQPEPDNRFENIVIGRSTWRTSVL